jgi:hypothetical protein
VLAIRHQIQAIDLDLKLKSFLANGDLNPGCRLESRIPAPFGSQNLQPVRLRYS